MKPFMKLARRRCLAAPFASFGNLFPLYGDFAYIMHSSAFSACLVGNQTSQRARAGKRRFSKPSTNAISSFTSNSNWGRDICDDCVCDGSDCAGKDSSGECDASRQQEILGLIYIFNGNGTLIALQIYIKHPLRWWLNHRKRATSTRWIP